MKKSFFFYLLFFIPSFFSSAQLIKQWDARFGGDSVELVKAILPAKNGGILLAGHSLSDTTGQKTNHSRGLADYWMISIDANGNLSWDKDFGGTGYDYCTASNLPLTEDIYLADILTHRPMAIKRRTAVEA